MFDLSPVYDLMLRLMPFETLEPRFMRQALLALALLAPMTAAMGVQVVNFRMAFFADAISHSAFAGVAMGLILSVDPGWSMAVFGVVVGLAIVAAQRRSALSSDTVIGVFFAAVVAFGLAVVSRDRNVARDMQRFLYGDILSIRDGEVVFLCFLFVALMAFQALAYNRLLYVGLNPALAQTHRVRVAVHQYLYAGLISLVVVFAVQAMGVLLVTAMLIVPGAAARNLARSAGAMFWWSIMIGLVSAVAGLFISAQDWARTATGATIILVAFGFFLISALAAWLRQGQPR
ncbi:MAG TPA: metal ABC transporter permease [Candidatus Brocadiia bacterium]|nr:metal ABC transporter permease [Candidatus Brocadiia bacterium]